MLCVLLLSTWTVLILSHCHNYQLFAIVRSSIEMYHLVLEAFPPTILTLRAGGRFDSHF